MHTMVIKRMFIGGGKNFIRGGAVSAATVLVMTVTLMIISFLIFLSALLTFTLGAMKDEVYISIYFVRTATEQRIFDVKEQIEKLPQVARVTYTSADTALPAFRAKYANDQSMLQSLDVLGYNPFSASLKVQAKDPLQYESIVNTLDATPALSESGSSIIDSINYNAKNKEAIDTLNTGINAVRKIGLAVIVVFAIASILIAFATIRLAIYISKEEIAVMKLVGASNAYVQGPFIVAGLITGALSATLVLLLLWPITGYVGSKTASWFGGFNLGQHYASNFFFVAGTVLLSGILLGSLASIFAIRKYLKA